MVKKNGTATDDGNCRANDGFKNDNESDDKKLVS